MKRYIKWLSTFGYIQTDEIEKGSYFDSLGKTNNEIAENARKAGTNVISVFVVK